ncbi:MAG TPA: hypothetical protein VNQ79_25395 [Blastocatellia bacterium]|nr:hypothetical protein [Blastocatellia bacterium]
MAESGCACHRFERLQGAATQAYISSFLERLAAQGAQYRCRVCGTRWQKVETEGERRASLIRLGEPGDSSSQSKSE